MRRLPVIVLMIVVSPAPACTRQLSPATVPATAREYLIGRVAITGNEPVTELTLLVDGGRPLRLLGELSGELRALQGATVRVSGQRTAEPPGSGFTVVQYEVLSIDGERPAVGVLASRDGRLVLVDGEEVQLIGAPPQLASRIGAKVWVVGPRTGGVIEVRSFGVIRAP